MKSRWSNPTFALLVLGLGLVFAVSPATAWTISDFQVNGAGTVGGTCGTSFGPGCVSNSGGVVAGAVSGTYTLSLTAGPSGAVQASGGFCFPANSTGQIITDIGDVIDFTTVGWLCEETFPTSSYHYNGTFRIFSGTGQFATAAGGGSLTGTFEKGLEAPTVTKLDGTLTF